MLWPYLVEYTEPGMPGISYLQQQGNMALFLTLFIVTCVEVLIVKVAQSERELEMMLTPHDPSYLSEYDDDEDEDDDICRVRASLNEEELRRQKKFLINHSRTSGDDLDFRETKKSENGFAHTLHKNNIQEKVNQRFQKKSEKATQWREHETDLMVQEKEDLNINTIKVRELIEKMVETIIEGPLDGTTVGQLSTHSACKNVSEVDSSDLKQSNLKRLIKRIISEAMALPNIKRNSCPSKTLNKTESDDFKTKSYEDILATAILNKIIDNFQNRNYAENRKVDGNPKPKLRKKKIRKNDSLKSDDDWSDTSRSDQLSLTIEEYIEEVTTTVEGSDSNCESDFSDLEMTNNRQIPFPESGKTVIDVGADDENSDFDEQNAATQLITSTSSWEENWLFQKKRLRSTPNAHHPVPVPMLVPNPSEDFRALVGGVDADDLSDISDNNDKVLEDLIMTEEKSAQHLNTNYETQEIFDNSAEQYETKKLKTEQTHAEEFFRQDKKIDILNSKVRNINENDDDRVLKEDDKYNALETSEDVQKNLPSLDLSEVLSQKDRDSSIEDFSHQYESKNSSSPSERAIQISEKMESEDCQRVCPLAEKEKEKWMNPVPLADNPYSSENINKRGQRKKNEYFRIGTNTRESVDFSEDLIRDEFLKEDTEKLRFSRDYYINASKHPSGTSSPYCNQYSKENNQKYTNSGTPNPIHSEKHNKLSVQKMQDKQSNETNPCRTVEKSQFSLPSVKELAKQFAIEDDKKIKYQYEGLQTKLESKHKIQILSTNDVPEKESEIDYSSVPVSEIILNFQQIAESPPRENYHKPVILYHALPATNMEICRKTDSNLIIKNHTENIKMPERIEAVRFDGKEVHSLTARSISKKFREGLKNHSYQKVCLKINGSSSGESDQGSIMSNKTKTSPTPSIDLKNMKKFWEEVITANSNMTKQK